ncbi:hypothetical protein [Streptomyces sp. I6]|uniref:hypothetical protein n=1 Tax=Streptomyces sp. I6 TaxID=2483113 RepID=UPI000F45C053|nr:hypothetical protein [Streptomyces sp. I6]RNL73172.1 hypothetical protein EBF04_23885 [Streptomyces sp. I6]
MTEAIDVKQGRGRKGRRMLAVGAVGVIAVLGAGLWMWEPWKDTTPFTAVRVSVAPGKYAEPGSTADSCVPHAAGKEVVIYDEDGQHELASAREPREGVVLPAEYGDFAGDCAVATRIPDVPGGHDAYVVQWGGGSKLKVPAEDLRRSAAEQREQLKTTTKP